jgi:hypothetical protein
MNNAKARKLQCLLITELLDKGSVELILPDGITLEIGIIQEDEFGEVKKTDDYCYVVATRGDKSTLLDSYNLGLQYESEEDTIVYEDETLDSNGRNLKTLEVI